MRSVLTAVAVLGFAVATAERCSAADSDVVKSISADSVVKWLEEVGGKAKKVNDELVHWSLDGREFGVGVYPKEPSLFLFRFYETAQASDALCNKWNGEHRFSTAVHPEKGKLAQQTAILVADGVTVNGLKRQVKVFVGASVAFEELLAELEKKDKPGGTGEKPPAVDADRVRAEIARTKK